MGAERAAQALASEPDVRLVFLFGSATHEEADHGARDLDLAVLVEPAPDLNAWRHLERVAALAAAVPLDLVPLHRASIVLAREVAVTGECLFTRTPEEETDFVVTANSRYLDFKPFLDEQWRLSGERAAERLRGLPT